MHDFFEIATVLFACILVHIFFNSWFGIRNYKRSTIAIIFLLYIVLHSIIAIFDISPILRVVISYCLILCLCGSLYRTGLYTAIFSALLFVALAVLSEYLPYVFLSLLGISSESLMGAGNDRAVLLALAKTTHFIVVLFAASILRKNTSRLTLRQVLPLMPSLLVSIFICLVFYKIAPTLD